ncbi:MAG: STAS domain-containing protein [Acidobacteria bacterium]|nr:STAS domain-containing protein [Acidobacteriota bacterium]MCG3194771.1 putative anti-sigma factor antagonist [Thermoanaerobaculia bacterium]MCK6684787.1 STAS domain-containing protein [Thermoanaerobaculia bacterium]
MNLSFEGQGDVVVVRLLSSRFEAEASDEFRRRMTEYIASGASHFVLDLSAVKFMDSGALGAVLSVVKSLPSTGDLRLAAVNDPVRTVLRLTRIDKVLSIFDDVDDALRSFGPSGG